MQIFDVIIFFELRTIQQKTVKTTYFCPLGAMKLAEGKGHETGRKRARHSKEKGTRLTSRALFGPPASWHPTDKEKLV